jgi:hypothetical protein
MAKKKRIDPIKQREKRAKIVAAVGGVLLIAVGFVEVPSVMSQLNKKPAAVSSAPVAATPGPGGALSLPQVGAAPAGVASTGLTDTDAPPAASGADGQLVSFAAFQMKNPFSPQVSSTPVNSNPPDPTPLPGAATSTAVVPATGATATPASTSSTPSTPATPLSILDTATGLTPSTGTSPTTTVGTTPTTTAGTTPTTTTPTPATVPTVAISVNGNVSRVGTAGTFPTAAPVFRLASWQHGSAEITIVGGSYATGGQTLTLRLNQPVTLQNTNNGKQYKLVLVSTP